MCLQIRSGAFFDLAKDLGVAPRRHVRDIAVRRVHLLEHFNEGKTPLFRGVAAGRPTNSKQSFTMPKKDLKRVRF
jgi:hypothetical protein